MNEAKFNFTDLLPLTSDPYATTNFRKISDEGVHLVEGPHGKEFLEVSNEAIRLLTATAMRDIAVSYTHLTLPTKLEV